MDIIDPARRAEAKQAIEQEGADEADFAEDCGACGMKIVRHTPQMAYAHARRCWTEKILSPRRHGRSMTYVTGTLSPAVEYDGKRYEYEVKRLGDQPVRVAICDDYAVAGAIASILTAAESVPR